MFDVVEAKYINDYIIEFRFSDNSSGKVDFAEYKNRQGLFSSLNDINYFKKFKIDNELATITWDNGLDIAPDTLYFKATGKVPDGLEII